MKPSNIAYSLRAVGALVAEQPFAFLASAVLHSAGRLFKAVASGLLVTLVLSQFLHSLRTPLIGTASPTVLALAGGVALPLVIGLEYLARRIILQAEARHAAGGPQKVGLFWSAAALISGIASALMFFVACSALAPVPTVIVAAIGIVGHTALRAHVLLSGKSGAARARAVFESVGRVNFAGEMIVATSIVAIFVLARQQLGFPEHFEMWGVVYLFFVRSMLANMTTANASLQRIVSIAGGRGNDTMTD